MTPFPTKVFFTQILIGRIPRCIAVFSVAVALLSSLEMMAQSGPPQGDTNTLCTWSFSDTNSWSSDLGNAALSWSNVVVTDEGDSGAGYAPLINAAAPAWISWNLVEPSSGSATTNLTLNLGSIFMWFSPDWSGTNNGGQGPGVYGRLLEVGSADGTNGYFGLYVDPAGCHLLFACGDDQGNVETYLTAPISWNSNDWHFLVLTYSSTNSAIYIDGSLATNGPGVAYLPDAQAQSNGFFLGSAGDSATTGSTNQARGVFDDLWTYGHLVTSNTVTAQWGSSDSAFIINPHNLVDYTAPQFVSSAQSYMTNAPVFRAISGAGYLQYIGDAANWAASTNVWMTNIVAKLGSNGLTTITFSVGGGTNDGRLYDVFGTGALLGHSIANSTWSWLGQVLAGCRYSISNIPNTTAYLILGTPQDTDMDGLPDSYELLVSHTDPNNPDTAGSGLADWFWTVYFGGNITLDPYSQCSSGDGWTLLQAYQNGWNPTNYYTPPPPQNVAARLDGSRTNAVITWQSGGGPVTNYEVLGIYDYWGSEDTEVLTQVDNLTFCFNEVVLPSNDPQSYNPVPRFKVRANLANGSYVDSQEVALYASDPGMSLMRGPMGQLYLLVQGVPSGMSYIRVTWYDYDAGVPGAVNLTAAQLAGGIAQLPVVVSGSALLGDLQAQAFSTSGNFGDVVALSEYTADENWDFSSWPEPFIDARAQMKENLKFLLRAATVNHPFSYEAGVTGNESDQWWSNPDPSETLQPETYYARSETLNNYEYYGFHTFSSNLNYSFIQPLRPVQDNFTWRNFVLGPSDFTSSGQFDTGAGPGFWPGNRLLVFPSYYYGDWLITPPAAFHLGSSNWVYAGAASYTGWPHESAPEGFLPDIGIVTNQSGIPVLTTGTVNYFGLPLASVAVDTNALLFPGESSSISGDCFASFQAPQLQIQSYYFASQTPYFSYISGAKNYSGPPLPLPGSPTFSTANTSPLLIASIGQPITVSAWAKMSITNGYAGGFAYLEQYFDKAYKIGDSGNVTTNETGVLSPYGEFFPTDPGKIALVTMPDIDTGQQGTGVVSVIKLQLDMNHDGNMDLTFGGPDNTSSSRPFVFWINNDDDWVTNPGYYEPGYDRPISPYFPDYDYKGDGPKSIRDLEDYARLWVCGVPTLTNAGYQVTMSWANVSSGSPAINLIKSVETNGGILYLTDTNILSSTGTAWKQMYVSPGRKYRVTSTNALTLPGDWFTNAGNKYCLFEGAGVGSGQLVLTILQTTPQGTNVIAQTGAWLDLHDIEDFYEATVITNNTSGTISNWTSGVRTVQYATVSDANETQDLIVMVHGINVDSWHWSNASETVFKRLYWAGYHGRFATVKWPCEFFNFWTLIQTDTSVFNRGEIKAYKAGTALPPYLSQLRARFPNDRLHLLAHSQGNAVVSEAILQSGMPFDTYILTQGAMPASAYDVETSTYLPSLTAEEVYGTPEWHPFGYWGVYTNSNFSGRLVNFYNYFDPVLDCWLADQAVAKPDGYLKHLSWLISPVGAMSSYYTTNGTTGWYNTPLGSGSYLVTDPQESRAMLSRGLTLPIGQSGPASAHGVIKSAVDLNAQFGFYTSFPDDHSAQWARPIQTSRPYYLQILDSIKP